MKRFLIFAWDQYYPSGGWHDFQASFDTRDEALDHILTLRCDRWQIVDLFSGKIVAYGPDVLS